MTAPVPPIWLIQIAVAAVWLYEGLWCKLLEGDANQYRIVAAVPRFGERWGRPFLKSLGLIEVALGLWVLSGWTPLICVLAQSILLVALNANGLIWSRRLIHDPAGMVVKNFGFLVLAWVAASQPRWTQ